MKYFKKIVGDKVYLSPMNVEDLEIYTKWMNDLQVTERLGTSDKIATLEGEKEWILNCNTKGSFQFAVIDKESDTIIGNCGFNDVNTIRQNGSIGIFIGDEVNRNKGYGTDAVRLLVKYGFEYLNLNNIMLTVYSFNEGAIKCYKKVGFKEFGRRHKAIPLKNKFYDIIYMEILREDYFND